MPGDTIGALGHPVVRTPNLDRITIEGTAFTAAYSPCPSCIAARVSIFTGQRPTTHGRLGYQDEVPWQYKNTFAEVLSHAGYQTHCIGKRHFYPQTLPMGFETFDSYEALQDFGGYYKNDYFEWLKQRTDVLEQDSGLGSNSWVGGESSLPMAMQFLTDGKIKYIWYTLTGEEQLFNLITDPEELHDLSDNHDNKELLLFWRARMVSELEDRVEDGLCANGKLISGNMLPAVRPSLLNIQ